MVELDIQESEAKTPAYVELSTPGTRLLGELAGARGFGVVGRHGERIDPDKFMDRNGPWDLMDSVRFENFFVLAPTGRAIHDLGWLFTQVSGIGAQVRENLGERAQDVRFHLGKYRPFRHEISPPRCSFAEKVGYSVMQRTIQFDVDVNLDSKYSDRLPREDMVSETTITVFPDVTMANMAIEQGIGAGKLKIDGSHFKDARRELARTSR